MRVIRRQRDNRIAILAGADIGRREALDLLLRGHDLLSESRNADDVRVKPQSERKIKHKTDNNCGDIAPPAALRYRRLARIGTAFQRNAVEYRPAKDRAEQDDGTKIAIGDQMRARPEL